MDPFSLVLRKGCRGHSPHFPALFPPTSSRTGNNEESLAGEGIEGAAVRSYLLQIIKLSEAQGASSFPGFLLPPA